MTKASIPKMEIKAFFIASAETKDLSFLLVVSLSPWLVDNILGVS